MSGTPAIPWLRHALALAVWLFVVGCAGAGGDSPAESPAEARAPSGVESRVVRGPVEMTVRVTKDAVEVGEKVDVEIDVVAAHGVSVQMPIPPDTLGAFAVRSSQRPPDVPGGSERRWSHVWTIDTFSPGMTELPPIEVSFTDERPEHATAEGSPIEATLASEPLSIDVRSVLGDEETEADVRDIKSTIAADEFDIVRSRRLRARLIAAAAIAGVLALIVAAGAFVWWRRTRPAPPPPPIPPDVWALGALDALAREGLPESGAFEAFFVRLSHIVRTYIEHRFAIMAPERTTDEFLIEAQRSAVLGDDHRASLGTFLRAADMVKFAMYRPSADECAGALAAARRFVEETRPVHSPESAPPGSPSPRPAGATDAQPTAAGEVRA